MKKFLLFAVSIMFFGVSAFGQNHGFRATKGDQAMIFEVAGLSEDILSNYNYGIGYMAYFADHYAFRISLGGSYRNDLEEHGDAGEVDRSSELINYGSSAGVRYNFGSSSNVLAYFGGEGFLSLSRSVSEGENFLDSDPKIVDRSVSYGAGVFLGAEWFPWRNVGLSAEYKLRAIFQEGRTEETDENGTHTERDPNSSRVDIGTNYIKLAVGFYFN